MLTANKVPCCITSLLPSFTNTIVKIFCEDNLYRVTKTKTKTNKQTDKQTTHTCNWNPHLVQNICLFLAFLNDFDILHVFLACKITESLKRPGKRQLFRTNPYVKLNNSFLQSLKIFIYSCIYNYIRLLTPHFSIVQCIFHRHAVPLHHLHSPPACEYNLALLSPIATMLIAPSR